MDYFRKKYLFLFFIGLLVIDQNLFLGKAFQINNTTITLTGTPDIIHWNGDYPNFIFNISEDQYINTQIFTIHWNYFDNQSLGSGYVENFSLYFANNMTKPIIYSLYHVVFSEYYTTIYMLNYTNGLYDEYTSRNITSSMGTTQLTDLPDTVTVNMSNFANIPFNSVVNLKIYLSSYYFEANSTLSFNYKNPPTLPTPADYMIYIYGGLILIGLTTTFYFYYINKQKKNPQKVFIREEEV